MNTRGIRLIIGLGNPGKKYENTYHNVGHLFIDYLIENQNVKCKMQNYNSKFKIIKSPVFMNKSGSFVKKMFKKIGVKPEELLIVHDDSDIYLGDYKFSFSRGAAGHHGAESVIKSLNTKEFWRLRIGIRPDGLADQRRLNADSRGILRRSAHSQRKSAPRAKAGEFVLKKISAAHKKILDEVFQKSALELE